MPATLQATCSIFVSCRRRVWFCQGRAANLRHFSGFSRSQESWHVGSCCSHRSIWNTPPGICRDPSAKVSHIMWTHVSAHWPEALFVVSRWTASLWRISWSVACVAVMRSGLGPRKTCSQWRCRRSFRLPKKQTDPEMVRAGNQRRGEPEQART